MTLYNAKIYARDFFEIFSLCPSFLEIFPSSFAIRNKLILLSREVFSPLFSQQFLKIRLAIILKCLIECITEVWVKNFFSTKDLNYKFNYFPDIEYS